MVSPRKEDAIAEVAEGEVTASDSLQSGSGNRRLRWQNSVDNSQIPTTSPVHYSLRDRSRRRQPQRLMKVTAISPDEDSSVTVQGELAGRREVV